MGTATRIRAAPTPVRIALALLLVVAVGLVLQTITAFPDPRPSFLNDVRGSLGYLGEIAAPYVLVPFVVGLLARSRRGAAVGGVVACWILVAAYYGWFLQGSFASMRGGTGEQATWLVAAVVAGAGGGLLGHASVRPGVARYVMPIALVLEPVAWLVLGRLGVAPVLTQPRAVPGAVVEAAIGVLWSILLLRYRSAARTTPGAPSRAV